MKIFTHQRKMEATSEEVFNAIKDPMLLVEWWGPKGFTNINESFEFKQDGRWIFVMHGPDGKDYPNEMIFLEIKRPDRIVMRHSVQPYFTATISIQDVGAGVIVTFIQDFDSEEVARSVAHIVKPSNEEVLDKLQAMVEKHK